MERDSADLVDHLVEAVTAAGGEVRAPRAAAQPLDREPLRAMTEA